MGVGRREFEMAELKTHRYPNFGKLEFGCFFFKARESHQGTERENMDLNLHFKVLHLTALCVTDRSKTQGKLEWALVSS